jgi:prepilin-type N-terminal cleavage/methylation domain-containing protein
VHVHDDAVSRVRVSDPSGFTLIEVLVTMVVLGITVAGMVAFFTMTNSRAAVTTDQSVSLTIVRTAVDTAVSDLRQAYYGDGTTAPIVAVSPTSLTFYSPDRSQPFHLREIAYRLSGGLFQRATVTSTNTGGPPWTGLTTFGPWVTEVDSVTSPTVFSYQDATGAATTDPTQVSRVTITLQVQPSGGGSGYTYQSSATIRAAGQ